MCAGFCNDRTSIVQTLGQLGIGAGLEGGMVYIGDPAQWEVSSMRSNLPLSEAWNQPRSARSDGPQTPFFGVQVSADDRSGRAASGAFHPGEEQGGRMRLPPQHLSCIPACAEYLKHCSRALGEFHDSLIRYYAVVHTTFSQ